MDQKSGLAGGRKLLVLSLGFTLTKMFDHRYCQFKTKKWDKIKLCNPSWITHLQLTLQTTIFLYNTTSCSWTFHRTHLNFNVLLTLYVWLMLNKVYYKMARIKKFLKRFVFWKRTWNREKLSASVYSLPSHYYDMARLSSINKGQKTVKIMGYAYI